MRCDATVLTVTAGVTRLGDMGDRRLAIVSLSLGLLMVCGAAAAESLGATTSSGETATAYAGSQHSRRLHNSPLAVNNLTARVRRVPCPTLSRYQTFHMLNGVAFRAHGLHNI